MSRREVPFGELASSDLIVDATYKGGTSGTFADDPLSKIMGCGNQGGFRIVGNLKRPKLAVLYSSLNDPDWPDALDYQTGLFVYYGDNKSPGHELHDTPRKGNLLLKLCFDAIHSSQNKRTKVPPFFVFTKGAEGRDVVFRGLAAPGSKLLRPTEDLAAIWKTKSKKRFQNYRAYFTILNVPVISRTWITELNKDNKLGSNCPMTWRNWVENGEYDALQSEPTLTYRKKAEQLPSNRTGKELIKHIHRYFKEDPFGFEHCAAEISRLMDPNIVSIDVTRPWRDGGRDAVGLYRIGTSSDNIEVKFALEAKCFDIDSSVGVRYMSRLISRLKHRQFGIFVTTSYVAEQAYKEIREDNHPVIVVSAVDIVRILTDSGIGTVEKLDKWLEHNFSK